MKVSCALIISDGTSIIAGRGTGKPDAKHSYDIAGKGCADQGEEHIDAAVRELREETGISLPSSAIRDIYDLGTHKYIAKKDLHVFLLKVDPLPSIDSLFCESTFESYGRELPELAGFKIISLSELDWLYPALEALLTSLPIEHALSACDEISLPTLRSHEKLRNIIAR